MQRPRPAAAGTPDPGALTERFFRGPYQAYDLHPAASTSWSRREPRATAAAAWPAS